MLLVPEIDSGLNQVRPFGPAQVVDQLDSGNRSQVTGREVEWVARIDRDDREWLLTS